MLPNHAVGNTSKRQKELQNVSVVQRFFQFLDHHFRILQYLSKGVPESAPWRQEGVLAGLQEELAQLWRRGLEKATTMEQILQVRNKSINTLNPEADLVVLAQP